MNNSEQQLIEQMADGIRKFYEIDEVITNLPEIVKLMNGTITKSLSVNGYPESKIKKTGSDSFEIELLSCETEPEKNNNIRIAEQLGHLFLHMGFQTDEDCWEKQDCNTYFVCQNSHQGVQACKFALALLMPKDLYKKKMDEYTEGAFVDIKKLSEYFNVRIDAIAERGYRLGYLRW